MQLQQRLSHCRDLFAIAKARYSLPVPTGRVHGPCTGVKMTPVFMGHVYGP